MKTQTKRWGDGEVGRAIADFGIRNAELKNLEGKRHKAQGAREKAKK